MNLLLIIKLYVDVLFIWSGCGETRVEFLMALSWDKSLRRSLLGVLSLIFV